MPSTPTVWPVIIVVNVNDLYFGKEVQVEHEVFATGGWEFARSME